MRLLKVCLQMIMFGLIQMLKAQNSFGYEATSVTPALSTKNSDFPATTSIPSISIAEREVVTTLMQINSTTPTEISNSPTHTATLVPSIRTVMTKINALTTKPTKTEQKREKAKSIITKVPVIPKMKLWTTAFVNEEVGSYGSKKKHDPSTAISALKVAEELINKNTTLLTDYDFQVTANPILFGIFHVLPKLMPLLSTKKEHMYSIIGPVNSPDFGACRYIIDNSKKALLQMNIGATDPTLSSKKLNPYVFSLMPSYSSFHTAIVFLFKKFNWKRVGLFYIVGAETSGNTDINIKVITDMSKKFSENQIEVVATDYVTVFNSINHKLTKKVIRNKLISFKNKDIRIIVAAFNRFQLPAILCEAYKLNMTSSKYQWILTNHPSYKRWGYSGTECTADEVDKASKNVLIPRLSLKRSDNVNTVANIKVNEVWELIKAKRRELETNLHEDELEYDERSLYAYDTLWTVALTLDRVMKKYKYTGESFTYDNFTTLDNLVNEMEKVQFQGMTGFIRFGRNRRGRVVDYTNFEVYGINGTFTHVGTYNAKINQVEYNISHQKNIFSPLVYEIPVDGVKTIHHPEKFSTATIAILWTFSVLATCLSVYFFAVNVFYRKKVLIKMSSPYINNLIVAGCILCYLAVILYGLDAKLIDVNKIPMTCNAVVFCLTFGFTLAFGALFSKTWRIYRIFTSARTLQVIVIKDIHLFGVIFLMLCLDSVILTTWMLTSPYELKIETVSFEERLEIDERHEQIIYRCSCHLQVHYGVALFLYKGVLLIFGLFLAWETRHIKVAAINDSKYIGLAVYNVGVLASIGSICSLALYQTTFYTELYVVLALCVLLCTTLTLIFVFGPKVKLIRKNFEDPNFKNGRPVLNSTGPSQRASNTTYYNKSEGNASEYQNQRRDVISNNDADFHTIPRKGTVESDYSDEQSPIVRKHECMKSNYCQNIFVNKYSE